MRYRTDEMKSPKQWAIKPAPCRPCPLLEDRETQLRQNSFSPLGVVRGFPELTSSSLLSWR